MSSMVIDEFVQITNRQHLGQTTRLVKQVLDALDEKACGTYNRDGVNQARHEITRANERLTAAHTLLTERNH